MKIHWIAAVGLLVSGGVAVAEEHAAEAAAKPAAGEILKELSAGNARFVSGNILGPHRGLDRVKLAADSDQANYALATVLSCADSRVPVELLFDAGVMDLFVVRVAGNVADTDEVGTIEYGLAHVKTPLLVVLGHSGCGAVKAVAQAMQGQGHALEKNIPPLVDNIGPAVQRAMKGHPEAKDAAVVPFAVEENVWQSVRDVFMRSAAVREMVAAGKVMVVGGIYDLPTGTVKWLDAKRPEEILAQVEKNPKRSMEVMAGGEAAHSEAHAEPAHAATPAPPAAPGAEVPVTVKHGDEKAH